MKILMTEQKACIGMGGSMTLLILESWMSIMHNIPYEVSTHRREKKCFRLRERKKCSPFLCTDFQHPLGDSNASLILYKDLSILLQSLIKSCPVFLYNTDNHNHKLYVTNHVKLLLHICRQNSVTYDS